MYKLLFTILLYLLTLNLFAQNEAFHSFLKLPATESASVSFVLYNLSSNKTVFAHNENKLLYPASLQKLLTTSAALDVLGSNFRFETQIQLKGALEQNKFKGIIQINASGDPSLSYYFVTQVYQFLQENNIQSFEGFIQINENKYVKETPQTWLIEDIGNYYGSPAFGFNFLENTYTLTFQQTDEGTKPTLVGHSPNMDHLTFENKLISAASSTKDNAYIIGLPFSSERQIVGTIPTGKGTFTIKGAIDQPDKVFKNMLLKRMKDEGIAFVYNENIASTTIFKEKIIKSKPLAELIKITNETSNNLYAEALLKQIAMTKTGKAATENGVQYLTSLYPNANLKIEDGSGLSRKNYVTANIVLTCLQKQDNQEVFKKSLAISGVSGTLKYFTSEKSKGKIFAKSGSADAIQNYAGYFTNSSGQKMAFVLMVNQFQGTNSAIRKEMLKVLESYI